MNYNKFTILEFKLESMVADPSIVMIAKRGSGKSYAVRDILYHHRHIPGGVVIAPTDGMNPFFKYFFPDLYIHYDIDSIILKKILARQTSMLDKRERYKKKNIKIDPSAILVMDDCLAAKKKWANDESIMTVLMNGRHYKLTYVLTMQTPLGITPDLRLNFDYVFLLKEDSQINHKKIYENYASIFPNLNVFKKAFVKCTEDHKCMVVDNRKPADNINEKIFWFKAADRKFTFGSKKFKDYHKRHYDPNYMRRKMAALLDINDMVPKKKGVENIGVILK